MTRNRKIFLSVAALVAIVMIVIGVALRMRASTAIIPGEEAALNEIETFTPPPVTIPDPQNERIGLQTESGVVYVRNFFPDAKEKNDEFLVLETGEKYDIIYFRERSSFLISIAALPVQENRLAAEAQLLGILDVSASTSCRLAISSSVPGYVDEALAGTAYGLSYCP